MNGKPEIVDRKTWLKARRALLREEKALTRYRDYVVAKRQALPWVKVEKNYTFTGPGGECSLADLFAGRSQLVIYHFMYGPDWEQGCDGCTQVADSFANSVPYLEMSDVSLVAVSRTILEKIDAYKRRMGWTFPWVSSLESDFNFDYYASYADPELGEKVFNFQKVQAAMDETHGHSVFVMDDGVIYHTYSSYARSADALMMHLQYQDLTPNGRGEDSGARRA